MPIKSNILGNIEAFKETSNVLVRGLPWKPPRSDDSLAVHRLRLTAARCSGTTKNINGILTVMRKNNY